MRLASFGQASTVCAFAFGFAGCVTSADPAYYGDPAVGLEVAQSLCSSCHAIGREGASPNPGAPPLRTVLATYRADRLVEDLEASVSISHRRMPTFYFGENHAADLVAYLQTIQEPVR